MQNKAFVVVMPQTSPRPVRVIEVGANALVEALAMHRKYPRCDVYVSPKPPLAWTDGDLGETLIYHVNDDKALKAQHTRSW